MSVNDKMKAIADAIRAHTGGTDALTLDAMVEAIAGLEVGGGAKIEYSSLTYSEDTSARSCVVEHGISERPDIVLVFVKNNDIYTESPNGLALYFAYQNWENDSSAEKGRAQTYYYDSSGALKVSAKTLSSTGYMGDDTITVFTGVSSVYLTAGVTYGVVIAKLWE